MKLFLALAMFVFLGAAAYAQPTPPQSTMDQLLSVHVNIETNLAKQLDAAQAQIQSLSAELAKTKAELEVAKKPPEPKK